MRKADFEMTARDVVEIVQLFEQNHIVVHVDRGCGVGAGIAGSTGV